MTHSSPPCAPPFLLTHTEHHGVPFLSTTEAGPLWRQEDREELANLAQHLAGPCMKVAWHLFGPDPKRPEYHAALLVLTLLGTKGRTIAAVVKGPDGAALYIGDLDGSILVTEDLRQLVRGFVEALIETPITH